MEDSTRPERSRPSAWRWGLVTLLVQLSLFAIPASIAWASTLDSTAWLPVVAVPATFVVGLVLLFSREWRREGAWIAVASTFAALLEVGLALLLIAMYADQHPGWNLS